MTEPTVSPPDPRRSRRSHALIDKSAWLLIAPAVAVLYFIDSAMLLTLVQWLVFAFVLLGAAVMVCRIVFPQVQLTRLVGLAERGNMAAAVVASALMGFLAVLVLSLVLWAKA